MTWLIAVPVWKERYRKIFCDYVLPSHIEALKQLDRPFRYVFQTDKPDEIVKAMETVKDLPGFKGVEVWHGTTDLDHYKAFSAFHKRAIGIAREGDTVVLSYADGVISREIFKSCAEALKTKRLVMLSGIRVKDTAIPPIGASSSELWEWSTAHFHKTMYDSIFGVGKSSHTSVVIFKKGSSTVMRSFHMTPFAFVKDRDLPFPNTADEGLPTFYERDEILVVQSKDFGAMVDLSDAKKVLPESKVLNVEQVLKWAPNAKPIHRWFFSHRCVITGEDEDCGDIEVAEAIRNMK